MVNNINIIHEFLKIFYLSFISCLIYIKIINYTTNNIKKNTIIFLDCIAVSLLYIYLTQYINQFIAFTSAYLLLKVSINIILKNKSFVIAFIISIIIAYMTHLISIIIAGVFMKILIPNITVESYLMLLSIFVTESLLLFLMFKIKRFKKGLNFLKEVDINRNVMIFTAFIAGITLLIFGAFKRVNNIVFNSLLFAVVILISTSLIIWIKGQVVKNYKKNMKERTIEIQKKEIDEQLKIIEEIKNENYRLASTIHKYNTKISALELGVKNAIKLNQDTEFAEELSLTLKEIERTSKNFTKETSIKDEIQLTNVLNIDNMIQYMREKANSNNIEFNCKMNENVKYLVNNLISNDKLETLIGDHINDAIIAINHSNNKFKSILVILEIVEKNYELSIYDTGIEFEIDTLLKLGLERTTTHKESGGTGIGFMTTFETLKECNASLIIEEYNKTTTNYTKSITIKFDGKNEYKIYSYRAEEIKEKSKDNRIIIQTL